MEKQFVPIYRDKNGNQLFFLSGEMVAESRLDAMELAFAYIPETVSLGLKYDQEIRRVDEGVPHVKAKVAGNYVAVISGPLFDEVNSEH